VGLCGVVDCGGYLAHGADAAAQDAVRPGLTAAEIDAIRHGEATDDRDRVVVRAVDEQNENSTISDPTWAELGGHFDQKRKDLVFTVGRYCLLAMAVNTFGIEDEDPDG
jgi:4-carboxymuconolactone decarboxylase